MKNNFLIILILFSCFLFARPLEESDEEKFENFIKKYGKVYDSEEEKSKRFEIFKKNLKKINELQKTLTYDVGINFYTDYSEDEFNKLVMNSEKINLASTLDSSKYVDYHSGQKLKGYENEVESLDWRTKDEYYISEVKSQGNCGSCFAFVFAQNLESRYYKLSRKKVKFSAQYYMDCLSGVTCETGGNFEMCFDYLKDKEEAATEESYPYECDASWWTCIKKKFTGDYIEFESVDFRYTSGEENMKKLLYEYGPFFGAFNILEKDNSYIMDYTGGIIDHDCPEGKKVGGHAVLFVGYGKDAKGKKYWIIKNSWGEKWGESGYFRIIRGVNQCSIEEYAKTVILN